MGTPYGQPAYYQGAPAPMVDPYYAEGFPMVLHIDPNGNYKTQLCKNWIETAKCRYQETCRYAHGQYELTEAAVASYGDEFKSKNCRTFYGTKQCHYGVGCMFRHEHRSWKQLHRHYYMPHMFKYERSYASAASKSNFMKTFVPEPERLPVFAQIHAQYDAERAAERQQMQAESDSELSEIEMSPEMMRNNDYSGEIEKSACGDSNQTSFLNTTVDSSIEESLPKIALNQCYSPARIHSDESSSEMCGDSDSEELDVCPRSLGLDFVEI